MKKRIVSLLLSLLLVASLPLTAFAAEWDLDDGDITVSVDGQGEQHVTQSKFDEISQSSTTKAGKDSNPTIKGGDGTQTITVSTTGESKANLTIENVNAKTIEVGGSNATITVSGENNTVSNNSGAGIHVSSGDLTITGDGTLEAEGRMASAGIGSNMHETMSGDITIADNAIVTGTSSSNGAGIGSGSGGEMSGSITIADNAIVTGTSSSNGAGIGSGNGGEMSGSITVKDDAQATGTSNNGAGIGSGNGNGGELSGSITVKDDAQATGTSNFGAGIGSGQYGDMSGNITVKNDAQATGTSNFGGAGIGSGQCGDMSGSITIDDAAKVTATASGSAFSGAGIGSGAGDGVQMSGTISISDKATVNASSTVTSESGTAGDAIGAGACATNTGKITYFDPDPEPTQSAPAEVPLYRVLNENGVSMGYTSVVKDGVLTITVKGDYARLTGTVAALKTLESRGCKAITLVTDNATSTFTIADLIAQGKEKDIYCLTHKGEEVTLTLNDEPLEGVLKDELL